ncbi:MAG: efflux RND transporter periplasmic adaptor subunit [Novosphingobium sp.]
MNPFHTSAGRAAILAILVGGTIGYTVARWTAPASAPSSNTAPAKKILYYYDPMVPLEHYDNPDTLSSMGMKTVPKYAESGNSAGTPPGVTIDPAPAQNFGMRVATVKRGELSQGVTATGVVDFNQRDLAVVQARSGGFVQRVYARAPGDVIAAGAPIADILVPEWGGAQNEFLAVKNTGDGPLIRASRQRLVLLGMSPGLIAGVERSGRVYNTVTITTPSGGVIRTLGVRSGMTVSAGQTLAEVSGLGTVWLNASVPEARAAQVRVGNVARVTFAAFPGEQRSGRITAILPEAEGASRTVSVRIELANRGGKLRPGMFAQVALGGEAHSALLVPSEAVIRTGTRNLVMLAGKNGHYSPAEVRIGAEANGQTEILAGLSEGEKIVASGQFLIDSEASLSGVAARPLSQ